MECVLCLKKIDKKKDLWVCESHFDKEKKVTDIFYHKKCHQEYHQEKFKQEYFKKMKKITPFLKLIVGGDQPYEIA